MFTAAIVLSIAIIVLSIIFAVVFALIWAIPAIMLLIAWGIYLFIVLA